MDSKVYKLRRLVYNSYRPISLTCIPCKIMDSIIKDHMLTFLNANILISANQHGFTPNKSTLTQLVECVHDWASAVESRSPVYIIYIDFKKAFDSASHTKLLYKLDRLDFSNKLIFWISSFLSSRYQRVKCGSSFFEFKPVTSGVPQGSVISPLLFLFINDLAKKELNCQIKLFAEDLKIYKVICSPLNCEILQCALNAISNWSDVWQLPIAVTKCACLVLNSVKNVVIITCYVDNIYNL